MLKRLVDLPGVAELERKALMNPRYADVDARQNFPDIDQTSIALFGITADEADEAPRPEGWDKIEMKPLRDQVIAFEAEGWDVTDKNRPLRMLSHLNVQLWLAIRGVAGQLPHAPVEEESAPTKDWAASLKADATRFRRDRR